MKGLIYLYKRTIINRIKKALKRPVTYIMIVFLLLYFAMLYSSFSVMIQEGQFSSTQNMVTILSIIIFVLDCLVNALQAILYLSLILYIFVWYLLYKIYFKRITHKFYVYFFCKYIMWNCSFCIRGIMV